MVGVRDHLPDKSNIALGMDDRYISSEPPLASDYIDIAAIIGTFYR